MQDRIYLSRISFTNKYLLIGLKRDRFAVRESSALCGFQYGLQSWT